jgi:hypothetical protein
LESASPSSYESYSAPSASASDAGTPVSAVVQAAAAPTSSASSAVSSSAAESSTEPSSTSSSAAASPSSGGASSGEFSGQATYYEAGLGVSPCGRCCSIQSLLTIRPADGPTLAPTTLSP